MKWRSIVLDPPLDGERILFYSLDLDFILVGTTRRGRWFDETDCLTDGSAPEVGEITHWMSLPTKPSRV